MRLRLFISVIIFMAAALAMAQTEAPPGPFKGFKSNDKTPVDVKADRMEAEMSGGKIRFFGHVRAKQGERVIYAERIDVHYAPDGTLITLEATGVVKVSMDDAFATCDRLLMDNAQRTIYLLGRPRVVQGKQIVTGKTMTYFMDTERFKISDPRVEWAPEEGAPGEPGKRKKSATRESE